MKKLALLLGALALAAVWIPSTANGESLSGEFGASRNLWIDRETLRSLPTSTPAWQHLAADATGGWGSANVADQESDHDVLTFAGALYAVRTNDVAMRNRVVEAIESAVGTEAGGRTLALGRNLTGYVLAADLIGYDSARFHNWVSAVRTSRLDGDTLIETHEWRANNWGTHAGAARIAADLYLGDSADLERAAQVFRGFLGDRAAYAGFKFGDPDWQADPSAPVPINPAGATINGINVDGALVDDIRRCGCAVTSPAPKENYQWEAMQGIAAQATLLHAAGYTDVWSRSDDAIYRAVRFLYEQAQFPAEGDDAFTTFLLDAGLGTDISTGVSASIGKSIGYTDFTHPTGSTATTRATIRPGVPTAAPVPAPITGTTPRATSPMRYVPTQPTRLFDTRTGQPSGQLNPGTKIDVQVTGRAGVPADADAVVLNVTATGAAGAGYVTVWPTGDLQPPTSSLNVTYPGETVPNFVTVPVGKDGKVSFYSLSALHLVADVSGYFVESDATRDGRFVPVKPQRAFDTRGTVAPSGAVGAGSTTSVVLAGKHGIPSSGASVAVLNVTAIGVGGPGHVTVYPHGTSLPLASSLNLNGAGDVRSNLVFAPIGTDGRVDFYSLSSAHLIGDVVGYMTSANANSSSTGMFVATNSVRHVDTRSGIPNRDARWIPGGSSARYRLAGRANVPSSDVDAVLANLTVTEAAGAGHVTIWRAGADRPGTSNVNVMWPGSTRSNAAVVELGSDDVQVYSHNGVHAIIDVFGYFVD